MVVVSGRSERNRWTQYTLSGVQRDSLHRRLTRGDAQVELSHVAGRDGRSSCGLSLGIGGNGRSRAGPGMQASRRVFGFDTT